MIDRHRLNLFDSGDENVKQFLIAQDITDNIFRTESLQINTLSMDFSAETSLKQRKELETRWIEILPHLDLVTALSCRHKVNQEFFEAVCEMNNIKYLHFWTSTVEDISSISKLQWLERLDLESFNQLKDITPILQLKHLRLLSITDSFKIENYDLIGQIANLKGLRLCGDTFAPKNLQLKSLKPFINLQQLTHLDLTSLSVKDNSYETILDLENLERFDLSINIPQQTRHLIKVNHKKLKAGFFIDWDFENNKLYSGKQW